MRSAIAGMAVLALASVALSQESSTPSQGEKRTPMQQAIEEFKTQTQDLGLRPDSVVTRRRQVGPKAEWHGRVYNNFRNDFLDAVPHEIRQNNGTKRTLRRNQFGFNISGPVVVPRLYHGAKRTFFSFSYEGVRERIGRPFLRTIATAEEQAGDWSNTVDSAGNPLPIYDPATTRPNPDFNPSQPVSTENVEYLRDPFPGNIIPQNRIDPVASRSLSFYPTPNTDIGPFFRNNYFLVSPETNIANGVIAKVDHSLRDRHRLSVGVNYSDGFSGAAAWFPGPANPGPVDRTFYTRRGQVEHVFTMTAQTVITTTFEAQKEGSASGQEGADWGQEIGLEGLPGDQFPVFEFRSPYLDFGRAFPEARNTRNIFNASAGISTRFGKHNPRATLFHQRQQVNTYWPQFPSGRFRFTSQLTSLPGIVNTGHAFASFLLGLSEFAEVTEVPSPSYFRRSHSSLEIRDRWEISSSLSINYGAEVELRTPRTEKYDRQSTVDFAAMNPQNGLPGAVVFSGREGWGSGLQPLMFSLAPRASVAWSPREDTRTVLRLSYVRNYSGIPIYFGQWGVQGFIGTPTYISPNPQLAPAVTLGHGVPPSPRPVPYLTGDTANDTVADLMDLSGRLPMTQYLSFSVERQMPGAFLVTAGAYASRGRNMLVGNAGVNLNAIPLDALSYRDALNDEMFNRTLRPFPQYVRFDVNSSYPIGRYKRDASYVRVEKRSSGGLTVATSYEYSKQMDDYSGPRGMQDFYNRQNEWSLTSYFRPHVLNMNYSYDLPIGPNQRYFNYSDWRRYLVEGWSVSGVTTWYSGEPLALFPQFNNTGGVVQALRVNVVPGVDPHVKKQTPELWFNPAAFDQPADFAIGNASRTHPTLRNPVTQNHDLSVRKRFQIAADRSMEFSAVGLNFVNLANWNDPDTMIGPESAPNVNAGRIIGSRGGRIVQLGLRFSF
jgi:hypothetical protein